MPGRRPPVLDELPDRFLYRPVARLLARGLAHTGLSANQVSGMAGVAGVLAGVVLALGWGITFAALLVTFMVLDCADGELARLRGGGGIWGRLADGVADFATSVAIHVGLAVRLSRSQPLPVAVGWSVAAAAGLLWTAYFVDRAKRRFRGDPDDPAVLSRLQQEVTGVRWWIVWWFLPYARWMGKGTAVPDRAAYQERMGSLLPWVFLVGPTNHFTLWAGLACFDRHVLYVWICVGPFNVVALLLRVMQERRERQSPPVVHVGGVSLPTPGGAP